jgi:hypothetical protein
MHTGNLSFIRIEPRFYTLAPVYDMLPMLYRPISGDIPERAFSPTGLTSNAADVWESAVTCAINFWDTTAEEQGISGDFRVICKQNLKVLHKLKAGPKIIAS